MTIATLVLVAALGAPSDAPMTVDQAIAFALAHNASVLAARSSFAAAGAQLAANRSAGLLTINGQAQSVMNRQSANNAGSFAQFGLSPSPNFSQNTTELQAGQSVFDLSTTLRAKDSRRLYDAAPHGRRRALRQVLP